MPFPLFFAFLIFSRLASVSPPGPSDSLRLSWSLPDQIADGPSPCAGFSRIAMVYPSTKPRAGASVSTTPLRTVKAIFSPDCRNTGAQAQYPSIILYKIASIHVFLVIVSNITLYIDVTCLLSLLFLPISLNNIVLICFHYSYFATLSPAPIIVRSGHT